MSNAIVCASLAFIINLTLSVLLLYKSHRERGRLIFAGFTLFYTLSTLYYVLNNGHVHSTSITPFSFQLLSTGSFAIVLFLVFPLEVLLPVHFKKRWFVGLFFIPVFLFNAIWIILSKSGMEVYCLSESRMILHELNNASIILRLVFFCFIILLFFGSILFMVWAHKRYMADRILRIYAYATIPVMAIYIFIVLYGLTDSLYILHMSYMVCFNIYISYLLIYSEGISDKDKKNRLIQKEAIEIAIAGNNMKQYEIDLLYELDQLMEVEKIYCSSDLCLPDLARTLGTNRTKLSEIIRMKGFSNFSAYLNSYRLEEFLRIMESNETEKILNAAFLAGFGSKASLYRYFIAVYGISPTEYLKR